MAGKGVSGQPIQVRWARLQTPDSTPKQLTPNELPFGFRPVRLEQMKELASLIDDPRAVSDIAAKLLAERPVSSAEAIESPGFCKDLYCNQVALSRPSPPLTRNWTRNSEGNYDASFRETSDTQLLLTFNRKLGVFGGHVQGQSQHTSGLYLAWRLDKGPTRSLITPSSRKALRPTILGNQPCCTLACRARTGG